MGGGWGDGGDSEDCGGHGGPTLREGVRESECSLLRLEKTDEAGTRQGDALQQRQDGACRGVSRGMPLSRLRQPHPELGRSEAAWRGRESGHCVSPYRTFLPPPESLHGNLGSLEGSDHWSAVGLSDWCDLEQTATCDFWESDYCGPCLLVFAPLGLIVDL